MDTVIIKDFIRKEQWMSAPICPIEKSEKKKFEEAVTDCNAVHLETFISELKKRVKERYQNAKS